MKSLIIVTCFIIAVSSNCVPDNGDGRPSCSSERSLTTLYRHYYDPTAFWYCQELNRPAYLRCDIGSLFSEEAGECVLAHEWRWTPTCVRNEEEQEETTQA